MQKITIHLIANAHLDPVWLWDWREGLNEGMATCRAVLNLMDEVPELTFIRGEAVIYQHLERHDPQTFNRIGKYVAQGRWDVVGGTWLQPDTNMPATETFARHFCHGQRYFQEKFGKPVRVAWAADSFGHSAGLPAILTGADIRGFAFTRPQSFILPIPKSAFWWESAGGARVLAYRPAIGWYGAERDEMERRLDEILVAGQNDGLENVGCFFGLGNHGGGPARRQLDDITRWSQRHPEVRVIYSGLHRLFDALYAEIARKGERFLPTHRGELNFCQRGCYASVAKFKYAYRRTEAMLASAERTDAVISAGLRCQSGDLRAAWDSVLFNSFHDILPGSSIERAYDEQLAWLGLAQHQAQSVRFDALNALAGRLDTSVPQSVGDFPTAVPLLVWNPHPHAFVGHVELEACLDYRPIWRYSDRVDQLPVEVRGPQGQLVPFQLVATEHHAMVNLAWRKRAIVPVKLPPLGWSVFTMGWVEGAKPVERGPVPLSVEAVVGAGSLKLWDRITLSAVTVEDPWGSWGGMDDPVESRNLSVVRDHWKVSRVEILERGPERSSVWVELLGGNSRLELKISQARGRSIIDFAARVLWNQRGARLKLVFSGAGERADFDVPGGSVTRGPLGEVPGGRWVRTAGFGFASDSLYGFDLTDGALRATVVRASRYCDDTKASPDTAAWLPAGDAGELQFRFALTPSDADLPRLSSELEQPPLVVLVPAKKGKLARAGSFLELAPGSLQLLALKRAEDGRGLIVRAQETAGRKVRGHLTWLGRRLELGPVAAFEVATWRLVGRKAARTNIFERPI